MLTVSSSISIKQNSILTQAQFLGLLLHLPLLLSSLFKSYVPEVMIIFSLGSIFECSVCIHDLFPSCLEMNVMRREKGNRGGITYLIESLGHLFSRKSRESQHLYFEGKEQEFWCAWTADVESCIVILEGWFWAILCSQVSCSGYGRAKGDFVQWLQSSTRRMRAQRYIYLNNLIVKEARTLNRAKLRPRFHCGDLEQEMTRTIRNIVIWWYATHVWL